MNIYIHIPFCHQKCHYCYYCSLVPASKNSVSEYLFSLEKEFKIKSKKFVLVEKEVDTVYFGGGTPNYLSVRQLEFLFGLLNKYLNLSKAKELVMEMDPFFCSVDQLKLLKMNGVTRLSFGLQTLNEEVLKRVNRQAVGDSLEKIKAAKQLGFNVNLDFILGLPGQSEEDVKQALELVRAAKPDSTFWCELRVGTPDMRKEQANLPSHIKVVKWHHLVKSQSETQGYYQVIPEYFSFKKELPLYLASWWIASQSLGFGLSAFSKMDGRFIKNTSDLRIYNKLLKDDKLPISYIYKLNNKEEALIFLSSSLRQGRADLVSIQEQTGVSLEKVLGLEIERLKKEGYLKYRNQEIILTKKGFSISSPVTNLLLKENIYLGKLMDTAFNYLDNCSDFGTFVYKNFSNFKKDTKGNILFSSPDGQSNGVFYSWGFI